RNLVRRVRRLPVRVFLEGLGHLRRLRPLVRCGARATGRHERQQARGEGPHGCGRLAFAGATVTTWPLASESDGLTTIDSLPSRPAITSTVLPKSRPMVIGMR